MEFGDDFSKDKARFCFLLGSALRNCNADQFVQVYDSVIPANYTPDEVCAIKAEAVRISDLCEEHFSELVLEARSFSLARPPHSSSSRRHSHFSAPECYSPEPDCSPSPPPPPPPPVAAASPYTETFHPEPQPDTLPDLPIFTSQPMDEASDKSPPSLTFRSLSRTSRHFNPHGSTLTMSDGSGNLNADLAASDSGLVGGGVEDTPAAVAARVTLTRASTANTSAVTTAAAAVENVAADSMSDDDSEQRGAFDYFRNTPPTVFRRELGLSAGADIAFEVEDASSPELDSPSGLKSASDDDLENDDHLYGMQEVSKRFQCAVNLTSRTSFESEEMREPEEMQELRKTQTSEYMCDEDDEDEDDELKYDSRTSMPYNRVESLNRMTQISNSIQYDESETVEDSDDAAEELNSILVEHPGGRYESDVNLDRVTVHHDLNEYPDILGLRHYTHNYSAEDPSGSLEQGPKRRINPPPSAAPSSSSTAQQQRPLQARTEKMYKQGLSMPYTSATSKAAVDAPIAFPTLNAPDKPTLPTKTKKQTSSEGTNIISSVTQRGSNPPFGDPPQIAKLSSTAGDIIQGRPIGEAKNMPRGAPIGQETNKSSKKKKKSKTDDGEGGDSARDENGNPVERTALLDAASATSSSQHTAYGTNRILVDQTGASTSSSSASSAKGEQQADAAGEQKDSATAAAAAAKKSKKKNKKDPGRVINVEGIPGYMGNKSVEDLLSFIETQKNGAGGGGGGGKGKKKAKNGVPAAAAAAAAATAAAAAAADSVPQTVQSVILPQQQKTPHPVDVNSKKGTSAPPTSNGPVGNNVGGKEGGGGKKKKSKGGNAEVPKIPENHVKNGQDSSAKSVSNNVKDSNTKSQPKARTSEKVDSEVTTPKSSTNSLVDMAGNGYNELQVVDGMYLFTDYIEDPPIEEEFKVVKKREKKKSSPAGPASNQAQTMNGNNRMWFANTKTYSIDSCDGPNNGGRPSAASGSSNRPTRPTPRPTPRSVTPPPPVQSASSSSSSSSLVAAAANKSSSRVTDPLADAHRQQQQQRPGTAGNNVMNGGGPTSNEGSSASKERALSPSSFPSLGSSTRGPAPRTRRNSTGNAADELDDSDDTQSVKSDSKVPSKATDPAPSPSVISYANVAAGGGVKKTEVEVVDKDDMRPPNDDLAAAAAASPRERRFSDGAVMSAENFPAMPSSTYARSVTSDNRTCSSNNDIHKQEACPPSRSQSHSAIAAMQQKEKQRLMPKSASEPPVIPQPSTTVAVAKTLPKLSPATAVIPKALAAAPPPPPPQTASIAPPQARARAPPLDATNVIPPSPVSDSHQAPTLPSPPPPPPPPLEAPPVLEHKNNNVPDLPIDTSNDFNLHFGFCEELPHHWRSADVVDVANNRVNNPSHPYNKIRLMEVESGLSFDASSSAAAAAAKSNEKTPSPPKESPPPPRDAPPPPADSVHIASTSAVSRESTPSGGDGEVVRRSGRPIPPRELDPNYQPGNFEYEKAVAFLNQQWEATSRKEINGLGRVVRYDWNTM